MCISLCSCIYDAVLLSSILDQKRAMPSLGEVGFPAGKFLLKELMPFRGMCSERHRPRHVLAIDAPLPPSAHHCPFFCLQASDSAQAHLQLMLWRLPLDHPPPGAFSPCMSCPRQAHSMLSALWPLSVRACPWGMEGRAPQPNDKAERAKNSQ